MELLPYTEEHHLFRRSLRKYFEQEVTPHVDQWEKDCIVPKSAWRKLGEQGFLCMDVPEEYGGLGLDFLYSLIMVEELARTNHCGLAAGLHSDVIVPYITAFGSEELKQKYLPRCISGECITAIAMTEPNTGSDLAAIRTTAAEDGDDVVLNGQKTFISNGINCDAVIVAARDPAVENPHEGLELYLVDDGTPGFEKGKQIEKIGWHSQDTAELFFSDCRISKSQRLGSKGGGFMMLMQKLQQERLLVCMMAVVAAERALALTIEYCKERKVFGRPISKFQHSQFKIVDMTMDVRLGRTFLDKLIVEHMNGESIVADVSMAKAWTTEMCNRVVGDCVQLHGGYGYCEEYPIARLWRDARVSTIFAGTNEIMRIIAAKFIGL